MLAVILFWVVLGLASFIMAGFFFVNDSWFKSKKLHTVILFIVCMLIGPIFWIAFLLVYVKNKLVAYLEKL